MRVCKSVCWGISIPLPWAICGQTDPMMFVLPDRLRFSQPRRMLMPLPACPSYFTAPLSLGGSGKAFIPFYLFILERSFRFQPSTTSTEWREQLFWREEHERRKSRCIWMHQAMHVRACLGPKCRTSRQFVQHLKLKDSDKRGFFFFLCLLHQTAGRFLWSSH